MDDTKAKEMLPEHVQKLAFNLSVKPYFLDEYRFWYIQEIRFDDIVKPRGKRFRLVDSRTGEVRDAFDHDRMAIQLASKLDARLDATDLPITDIVELQEQAIVIMVDKRKFQCNLLDDHIVERKSYEIVADYELKSPDGKWVAYVDQYNLYVRSLEQGDIIQLTTDGEKEYAYATLPDAYGSKLVDELAAKKLPPMAIWSPDSSHLFTHKTDQRHVRTMYIAQYVPEGDGVPPKTHAMRYALPGDEHVPRLELVVCSLTGEQVFLKTDPLEMSALQYTLFDPSAPIAWWLDEQHVYYLHVSRGTKSTRLCVAHSHSGEVTIIYEECADTFMQMDFIPRGKSVHVLRDQTACIWLSARTGWNHLYMIQIGSEKKEYALTEGEYAVDAIVQVDEKNGYVYFLANGREEGLHPYYRQLYRVSFTGGSIERLTPENADHRIVFSPELSSFVDTYSRVDLSPITVVRAYDGKLIATIQSSDIELLLAHGYQLPEVFHVKASDGVTDLYGVFIRPVPFEENKKYPIIDFAYGGVHTTFAPTTFPLTAQGRDQMHIAQSLAQLGFVVIMMDGMGTPGRSKAFYDVCYKNLQGAAGIQDHVLGTRELAERFPFIDIERVGMYGFSGGGYGSVRAMLEFPEFYKVAVAGCGDHDNRLYSVEWGERYQGLYDEDIYQQQVSPTLAQQLEGKLFLMHGDIDDNVHMHHTMRMVDALIHADKDFDLLILPNRGHALSRDPYVIRRIMKYFTQNL